MLISVFFFRDDVDGSFCFPPCEIHMLDENLATASRRFVLELGEHVGQYSASLFTLLSPTPQPPTPARTRARSGSQYSGSSRTISCDGMLWSILCARFSYVILLVAWWRSDMRFDKVGSKKR